MFQFYFLFITALYYTSISPSLMYNIIFFIVYHEEKRVNREIYSELSIISHNSWILTFCQRLLKFFLPPASGEGALQ